MDVERSEFWEGTSETSQQRQTGESWEAFGKGNIGELE